MCKVTALLRPTKTQLSGQRESNAQCLKNKKRVSAFQQFQGPELPLSTVLDLSVSLRKVL